MTKSEAIRHRALRCRPGNSDRYVAKHDALLAEAEWMQSGIYAGVVNTQRRSLWQIIKGWFA